MSISSRSDSSSSSSSLDLEELLKIGARCRENIPAHIGRKFPRRVSGLVKLEVLDGRSWIVQRNFLGGSLRSLGNGWSEFVHQTKLKIDDICAFELICNDKEFSMKVSIYRNKPLSR